MKKSILLLTLLFLCSSCAFAVINKPSAPTYSTSGTVNMSNPSDKYKKPSARKNSSVKPVDEDKLKTLDPTYVDPEAPVENQLRAMAMSVLKAAENRDNAGMNKIIKQMAQKGVTSVTSPEVVAKRTPTCPPIKMELEKGRIISGSKCARFSYTYEGHDYWVGYCK